MGFFNFISKQPVSSGPYKNEGLNKVYELLFCDKIALYRGENKPSGYPWDILLADKPAIDKLKGITEDKGLESRQRVLAYNLLAAQGSPAVQKELLGVIVEVALPGGLDVLAAYSDGSARYLNQAEKVLIWETKTEASNALVRELLTHSINVVNKIGPWDQPRKPFPDKGMVRLSFLVSNGLYFGEGPFEQLAGDSMGGPVIHAATQLMAFLTRQPTGA